MGSLSVTSGARVAPSLFRMYGAGMWIQAKLSPLFLHHAAPVFKKRSNTEFQTSIRPLQPSRISTFIMYNPHQGQNPGQQPPLPGHQFPQQPGFMTSNMVPGASGPATMMQNAANMPHQSKLSSSIHLYLLSCCHCLAANAKRA